MTRETTQSKYPIREVQKLSDGRFTVIREDGARLSLFYDEWAWCLLEMLKMRHETPKDNGNG